MTGTIPKCRAVNCALEWTGSTVQVSGPAAAAVATSAIAATNVKTIGFMLALYEAGRQTLGKEAEAR